MLGYGEARVRVTGVLDITVVINVENTHMSLCVSVL